MNVHTCKCRFVASVLSIMLILSMFSIGTFAESSSDIDLTDVTSFVFDGDTVTVYEGDDDNYEVVVYDSTDTETDADVSYDSDGNTVYSLPDDSSGQLLVSIKKKGGEYVFSGSGNGSIAVKKEATGDAVIYLDGLELTSSFTSVITVKKDSTATCTIYAVDGTLNTLTDNICNDDETYTDNAAAENAVLKFKDSSDVTITGTGTITICGNGKNGIKSNNLLTIDGGVTLNITAVNDGINCEQELTINETTITVDAGDDGIHSDYYLTMGTEDGDDDDTVINILDCYEGIEAAEINLYSGTVTVYAEDDCANAANSDLTDYDFVFNIYGGTYYMAATAGDCLDSNGDLSIYGGTIIALGSLDNTSESNVALDCDGTMTIDGGTVLGVCTSEMAETPSSGQAYVTWTSAGSSTAANAGSNSSQGGSSQGGSSQGGSSQGGFSQVSSSQGGFGGNSSQGGSSLSISNGDKLTITDSSGNQLFSTTVIWNTTLTYSLNYVIYSDASISSGSSYTLSVTSGSATATGLILNTGAVSLTQGEDITLVATVVPTAFSDSITWSSSNTDVATVSGGTVTAVGAGTATITASTSSGLSASATITVEEKTFTAVYENGVYFAKPSSWGSNIYIYLFSNDTTVGAEWPGTLMTEIEDGIYGYEYTSTDSDLMVIFNDGSNQTEDLVYVNNGYYTSSGYVKTVEPSSSDDDDDDATTTGTVIVQYVDSDGNILSTTTLTGTVGDTYTTSAKTISGYTLSSTPSNASGTYTSSTITVTYVYTADSDTTEELANSSGVSATSITKGDSITLTGAASGGTEPYYYAFYAKLSTSSAYTTLRSYSTTSTKTWTPSSIGTYYIIIRVKDSDGTVLDKSFTLTVSSSSSDSTELTNNSTISSTSITKGTSLTLTGAASGGTSPYYYSFIAKLSTSSSFTTLRDYSTTATKTWTPSSTGTYTVRIKVKDATGTIVSKTFTVTVSSAELTNNSTISATSIAKGDSLTLTGKASGGTSPYYYSFIAKLSTSSSFTTLRDYSTTATKTWTPSSTGTYTVRIKVKDATGTIVSKTFTVTVSSAELTNNSTISATSITKGTTLTLTGAASGGTEPYYYSFIAKLSTASSFTTLRDYSTTATKTWTPSSTGTYTVRIKVKDADGTIVSKTFTVTVK